MQEFITELRPHLPGIIAALIVLILSVIKFVDSWVKQREKLLDLETRLKEIDVDDTERTRKISADAQDLIQKTFIGQAETIRGLQDELRHQRDLIDTSASERANLQGQKEQLEKSLNTALAQQAENVKKLAAMETIVGRLKELESENTTLKGQVAELRQKVEDADVKADLRHEEMSKLTGANAELYVKLRRANADLAKIQQSLQACSDQVAKLGGTPVAMPTLSGDISVEVQEVSNDSAKG